MPQTTCVMHGRGWHMHAVLAPPSPITSASAAQYEPLTTWAAVLSECMLTNLTCMQYTTGAAVLPECMLMNLIRMQYVPRPATLSSVSADAFEQLEAELQMQQELKRQQQLHQERLQHIDAMRAQRDQVGCCSMRLNQSDAWGGVFVGMGTGGLMPVRLLCLQRAQLAPDFIETSFVTNELIGTRQHASRMPALGQECSLP
eukprot:1161722-Pelagomonas_calceolata.AAC.6